MKVRCIDNSGTLQLRLNTVYVVSYIEHKYGGSYYYVEERGHAPSGPWRPSRFEVEDTLQPGWNYCSCGATTQNASKRCCDCVRA